MKMIKLNKWLPVLFLLFTWYVPRNTAPGSFFENYIILRWSTYIIIPLALVLFLFTKLLKPKINITNIFFPVISISFVIIFSGLVNESSLLTIAFTILTYLRYPLLFIVLLNTDIDKKTLKLFIKVFFILLIMQIPEVFYRFSVLGIRWDYISRTLGPWGTFDLGVYMIYATALIVARNLIVRVKMIHIILIFCFFFIALIGEIKAFIFFTPLVVGLMVFNHVKKNIVKKRTYKIAVITIAAIGTAFIFSINWYGKIFPGNRDIERIIGAITRQEDVKLPRINSFFTIIKEVKADSSNFWLGWGPGASLEGSYLAEKGKIFEFTKYKNQLSEIFMDMGIIGMIVYYWLLLSLLSRFLRHIRIENEKNYIILNRALVGMWFFYAVLGPFYDLVWRHDSPNFIFYFLTAALYARYRRKKNENFVNK